MTKWETGVRTKWETGAHVSTPPGLGVPTTTELLVITPTCGVSFSDATIYWQTVKWLSYGANMHSARLAKEAGFDNALLLRRDDAAAPGAMRGAAAAGDAELAPLAVLDGPNFAVAWSDAAGETLFTPDWRALGMLQSTTLTLMLEVRRRSSALRLLACSPWSLSLSFFFSFFFFSFFFALLLLLLRASSSPSSRFFFFSCLLLRTSRPSRFALLALLLLLASPS